MIFSHDILGAIMKHKFLSNMMENELLQGTGMRFFCPKPNAVTVSCITTVTP